MGVVLFLGLFCIRLYTPWGVFLVSCFTMMKKNDTAAATSETISQHLEGLIKYFKIEVFLTNIYLSDTTVVFW